MIKKILLILVTIGVILGIAAYFFYDFTIGGEKEVATKTIKNVYSGQAISLINSYNNDAVWFANDQGRLFRMTALDNSLSEYSLPPLIDAKLKSIIWPNKGNDFIFLASDSLGEAKRYYSDSQKKFTILPENVKNLDWLNDGMRIVMVWKSGDGTVKLVVANPDASGYTIIKDLPWEDMLIKASPTANTALLVKQNITGEVNKIYLFDLANGNYTEVVASGKNTGTKWAPDGSHFIYSAFVEGQNKLFYYNLLTNQSTDLGIDSSLDKIFFAENGRNLYAATSNSAGSGDEFVKIDLDTFSKEMVYAPEQTTRAKNLIAVGGKIFFINAADDQLYAIE